MATLSQQRAAIRQGITDARRATGEAERDAIGQRLINERRGTDVAEDLNRLQKPPRSRKSLPTAQPVGSLPAQVGVGQFKPTPATTTPGGIASPLTETLFADREWWSGGIPSTDGLLMMPAVKKIVMTDANGAEVIFEYADPTP